MSRTDTWMPLYVADYIADTQRLSLAEHGAYLLLLMEYWRNGPLPDDDKELAAIVHADRKLWDREIGPSIRRFFHVQDDGRLHQKRLDVERSKAIQISDKRRDAVAQRRDRLPTTDIQTDNKPLTIVSDLKTHARGRPIPRQLPKKDTVLRTDAAASTVDPKTELWKEGRAIVGRWSCPAGKTVGGLVGMFVNDAKAVDGSVDHALVLDVLREADRNAPDQPIPWTRAAIRARVSPGPLLGELDPDDPAGIHAWCAANGVEQATLPGDLAIAKWLVGGSLFDKTAIDILLVTDMHFDRRLDWSLLRQWIEAGINVETIYQTIKRMVTGMKARGDYTAPGSLKFFDNAVRQSSERATA